ncbi:protein kinase family protein [Dietzia aurantiaca]|uniref:Protein kinase family protein n=1 Tax=Dietzia aurantiaca TaxID=983873 RepID=A0ABV9PP28_9ACTN
MGENTEGPARGDVPTPPRLTVGGLVAGGRYELLERHGGVAGQSFWKARDKRLGRTVALTFVDPLPGETPPGSATGVLDRTVALTAVYSDGLSRVLDVIRGRAGGIVVTEWIPGTSLAAAVANPDPGSAVGAVWGLSDAATRTEEANLALGLDSPDRVRLTEDGRAVLAFPGVTPDVDARSDVRGLGAVLYALLTGAWPVELPKGTDAHEHVDGRPEAAPRDDDELVDPTVVNPDVPPESAVLAMRSLDGSAVSSAATVRSMVTDRTGGPVRANRSAAAGAAGVAASASGGPAGAYPGFSAGAGGVDGGPAAASSSSYSPGAVSSSPQGPDPGSPADTSERSWSDTADEPDPDVLRRRWQIMAGAGAVAVVAIVLLSVWMLGALGNDRNNTPLSQQLDAIERAAQASRSSEAAAPPAEDEGTGGSGADSAEKQDEASLSPLSVTTVTSWQPASSNGTAENSSSAANVIDGNPSTSWSTDTYRNQFGNSASSYKAGIGLMFTLDSAEKVRELEISADEDIRFEIRSAESASPTSLDDTTRLGSGRVEDGRATVTIEDADETEYLLLWITRLGTVGPQAYQAAVSEVNVLG